MQPHGSSEDASSSRNEDEEAGPRTPMLGTTTSERGPPEATGDQTSDDTLSRELIIQEQQQNQKQETWLDKRLHDVTALGNLEHFDGALRALGDDTQVENVLKAKTLVELRWRGIAVVESDSGGLSAENDVRESRESVTQLRTFCEQTNGTVLHLASVHGHLEIVKYLVETRRQSVDAPCDSGSTPIYLAVAHSHLNVVDFLISAGARIDAPDISNRKFLHYAILSGNSNTVNHALQIIGEKMLDDKFDWLQLGPGKTVDQFLQVFTESQKEYLRHRSISDVESPLVLASRLGLFEVLKTLLNYKGIRRYVNFRSGCHDNTALHVACSRSNQLATDIVQLLLEVKSDTCMLNSEGKTPFMLAVEAGAVNTIDLLSRYNKQFFTGKDGRNYRYISHDRNSYFPEPHIKKSRERKTILNMSYFFAVINDSGKSAWDYAVEQQSNDVWIALLKAAWFSSDLPAPKNSDCDRRSDDQFTSQEAAVELNDDDTWLQKLQYFVVVRSENESTTPLHMAASKGDVGKIKIMLQCGFRLEKMLDSLGNTFLHTAAREGQAGVIRDFATMPDYVNQRNKNGDSVLSVACSSGREECIKLLLPKADLSLLNEQGRTALQELCVQGFLPISLLQDVVQRSADRSWFGTPIVLAHKDKTGRNALHLLAGNRNLVQRESVFKLFYRRELDLIWHDKKEKGRHLLHEALYNHSVDNAIALMSTFGLLLNFKAVDDRGLTPLHVAVQECLPLAVRPLVESGADLSYYDDAGNSPLHTLITFACKQPERQKEYIELLREILDCAVVWYCKERRKPVLSKKSDQYLKYYKAAVTRLLTAVYNGYRMNVLMWAAYKCVECGELLSVLLTLPDVFCPRTHEQKTPPKRNDEYAYYDVTNIVPATMSPLPCARRVGRHFAVEIFKVDGVTICTSGEEDETALYPKMQGDDNALADDLLMQGEDNDRAELRLISHLTRWSKHSLVDIIVGTHDRFREKRLLLLEITPISEITMKYSRPYRYMYAILMIIHLIYMWFFSTHSLSVTASADLSCDPTNMTSVHSNISRIHELPAEIGPSYTLLVWPCLIIVSDLLYCLFYFWRSGFKWPRVFRNWSFHRAICGPFRNLDIARMNIFWCCGIVFSWFVIIWFLMNAQRSCHQDYVLAVTMVTGWLYAINFTQSIRSVYHFSLILQHIVLKDLFKFSFVFASLLVGYAFAFQVLTLSIPSLRQEFPSMDYTFFIVFHWLIGMGEFYKVPPEELASHGKSATMMNVTFVSYVILLNVVLLNLLVAIMNNTFSSIYQRDLVAWHVSSLQHVLDVENHYPFVGAIIQKFRITGERTSEKISFRSKVLQNLRSGEIVRDTSSNQTRFFLKVERAGTLSEENATPGKLA